MWRELDLSRIKRIGWYYPVPETIQLGADVYEAPPDPPPLQLYIEGDGCYFTAELKNPTWHETSLS